MSLDGSGRDCGPPKPLTPIQFVFVWTVILSLGTGIAFGFCALFGGSKPQIATKEELIRQGVISEKNIKRTPTIKEVKAEAEPQLSPDAIKAIQTEAELKRAQSRVKDMETNPFLSASINEAKQEHEIMMLKSTVSRLSVDIDRLEAKIKTLEEQRNAIRIKP